MAKPARATIEVKGSEITVRAEKAGDFISLTDISRSRSSEHAEELIRTWLRNRNTVEFLGTWERLNNPEFDLAAFDEISAQAGLNIFSLTPNQWADQTGAIGIMIRTGRNGGIFAHTDIAFEFASWISSEFKLYLIKDFQRLKEEENHRLALQWNLPRTLSKINYRFHSEAVRAKLVPPHVTPEQASETYSAEGDVLNVALFGQTAEEWRTENPGLRGNMRDHATVEQLLVLANLEMMNAEFIHMDMPQEERVRRLNRVAIRQMEALTEAAALPERIGA
jgi:hypothetical protein